MYYLLTKSKIEPLVRVLLSFISWSVIETLFSTGGISVKEVELFTLDRGVSWTIAMEAWRIILDTDDSDYRTPDLIDDDKRREVRVQFTGDRHHCNALGFTFTTMGTTTTNMRRRKKSI